MYGLREVTGQRGYRPPPPLAWAPVLVTRLEWRGVGLAEGDLEHSNNKGRMKDVSGMSVGIAHVVGAGSVKARGRRRRRLTHTHGQRTAGTRGREHTACGEAHSSYSHPHHQAHHGAPTWHSTAVRESPHARATHVTRPSATRGGPLRGLACAQSHLAARRPSPNQPHSSHTNLVTFRET